MSTTSSTGLVHIGGVDALHEYFCLGFVGVDRDEVNHGRRLSGGGDGVLHLPDRVSQREREISRIAISRIAASLRPFPENP